MPAIQSVLSHKKITTISAGALIVLTLGGFLAVRLHVLADVAPLPAGTYCQGPQLSQPSSGPTHVINIVLENESQQTVESSPDATFQRNTLNAQCGDFAAGAMHSTSHGSESNYIALTSGLDASYNTGTDAAANFALSDCPPGNQAPNSSCTYGQGTIPATVPSIYSQVEQKYGTGGWKEYSDSMAANCTPNDAVKYATDAGGANYNLYVSRHNPAIFYNGIACSSQNVGSGNWQAGQGPLYNDLTSGNMPYYSFIQPNEIENGHDPVSVTKNGVTTTIAGGTSQIGNIDTYLSTLMPLIQQSPQYQNGSLVVMITYDEGEAGGPVTGEDSVGEHCASPTVSPLAYSCQVETWIIGRYVPHTSYSSYSNEFALTGADQRILGLSPLLGHAGDVTTPDLVDGTSASPDPFNLSPTGPVTAPTSPQNVTAVPGSASAAVSFSQPATTGGSPITAYTVTASPGGITATGTTSPINVTGLTNNTAYTFTVTAANAVGTSSASPPSASVTPLPAAAPSAPTAVVATAGNNLVMLSWTAPPPVSGAPLVDYIVQYSPSGANNWTSVDEQSTALNATVSGLVNNASYDFTVAAVNSGGTGSTSSIVSATPTAQLLPDPGFESGNGGWIPFNIGTLTRVTSPVHGGLYGLQVASPSAATNSLVGLTQNSVVSNSVAGKTYTAYCYAWPTSANLNVQMGFLEYTQNYSSDIHFTNTKISSLPLNTWTLVQASATAVNSGERMIPQIWSTNETTATGSIVYDDCSVTAAATVVAPGAPTAVTATAGNSSALVSFTPPASNGGAPVTSYTVTSNPGNITATGSSSPLTVSGLTGGTTYTFTVAATNSAGISAPSAPSTSITLPGLPGAPTSVTATPGNGTATVAFAAPASNGGSIITNYTVTASPGNITASGNNSPITVPGLTNGTVYTFTVIAQNSIGAGTVSASSSPATPAAPPDVPTNLTSLAGDGQVSLSWSAPASNGGAPVTDYIVQESQSGANQWVTIADGISASTTATVNGLTDGTGYDFQVAAINSSGQGNFSAATSATPQAVLTTPAMPTAVTAAASDSKATVVFTPPVSNGGSAITGYTVTSKPGNITATGTGSPITVTGLSNGTSYAFTVAATNAIGTGSASAASNSVTPAGVPGVPTALIVTPQNGQVSLSWSAPNTNGGAPITDYIVQYRITGNNGMWLTDDTSSTATTATITNLMDGVSYDFEVSAVNSVGQSGYSANASASPSVTIPGAPASVTAAASDSQATVSFTAPSTDGGSAITGYTVTSNPGSITATGTTSPITVTGLTNGTGYTFTVTATNATGTGVASPASNTVTPVGAPGAPTAVTATAGNSSALVTFTPPASNGGAPVTSYTVISNPGNITATGSSSPLTVSGLTGGTTYTFTVAATNSVGTGVASLVSAPVTLSNVPTLPAAPTAVTAASANSSAVVSFVTASDGGAPITSYTVTASPGNIAAAGSGSPITVTGLTNGTSYTFTVTATNSVGTSVASGPSLAVVPATAPAAPTAVTAKPGNASVIVSFTAPGSNGGAPVTGYTVTSSPGSIIATGTQSPITVSGLTNNTAYTFKVTAINNAGTGLASVASASVTPVIQLLPDPGFESGNGGWIPFNIGTLTRVTSPVHGGLYGLQVASPSAATNSLVGLTQNSVVSNSVAGKTYTAYCYAWPTSANLNVQMGFLEYTQNYSSDIHFTNTKISSLPLNTWTLVQASATAVNSGERMIPQIWSTNETTATGSIVYDDCSVSSN